MWKKIHSNRDPKDTLGSEIKKEFKVYFSLVSSMLNGLFLAYPKFIFCCMVFLIALSLVLSFTISQNPEKLKVPVIKKLNLVEDGFSQITLATGNIRETLRLRKMVDSLAAKKQLSVKDSAILDSLLDRFNKTGHTNR